MRKNKKINLLISTNTEQVSFLMMMKKILQRLVLAALFIIVFGTAGIYILVYINTNRINEMQEDLEIYESNVEEVRERTKLNNSYKNELDNLIKHGLDIETAPAFTEALIYDIVNYTGPAEVILNVYEYAIDTKTDVHSLLLQGYSQYAEAPLIFAEMLRELPTIESVSISGETANVRENIINFKVTCVLRGEDNENP